MIITPPDRRPARIRALPKVAAAERDTPTIPIKAGKKGGSA